MVIRKIYHQPAPVDVSRLAIGLSPMPQASGEVTRINFAKSDIEAILGPADRRLSLGLSAPVFLKKSDETSPWIGLLAGVSLPILGMSIERSQAMEREGFRLLQSARSLRTPHERQQFATQLVKDLEEHPENLPAIQEMLRHSGTITPSMTQAIISLRLDRWAELASSNPFVLTLLNHLHLLFRHPRATQILSTIDLEKFAGFSKDHWENQRAIFQLLRPAIQLNNSSAWTFFDSLRPATVTQGIKLGDPKGQHQEETLDALEMLIFMARNPGPGHQEALKWLEETTSVEWIRHEGVYALHNVLIPMANLGNEAALRYIREISVEEIVRLQGYRQHPTFDRNLYYSLSLLSEFGSKAAFNILYNHAVTGTPYAMQEMYYLLRSGNPQAQEVYRNHTQGVGKDRLAKFLDSPLGKAIFTEKSSKNNLVFRSAREQRITHRMMKVCERNLFFAQLGEIQKNEILQGLIQGWLKEGNKPFYLARHLGHPMTLDMIPSSYVDAYLEESRSRMLNRRAIKHTGPDFRYFSQREMAGQIIQDFELKPRAAQVEFLSKSWDRWQSLTKEERAEFGNPDEGIPTPHWLQKMALESGYIPRERSPIVRPESEDPEVLRAGIRLMLRFQFPELGSMTTPEMEEWVLDMQRDWSALSIQERALFQRSPQDWGLPASYVMSRMLERNYELSQQKAAEEREEQDRENRGGRH